MLPQLVDVLTAHRQRASKLVAWKGTDWIFPSKSKTLRQPSGLANAFEVPAAAARIKNTATPHGLRCFFSDALRTAGVER